MADIFDKIVSGLNKGVQTLKNTSDIAIEKASVRQSINNLEKSKNEMFTNSGMLAYGMYMDGEIVDERLKNIFVHIDSCNVKLSELKAKLDELNAASSMQAAPSKICPDCGNYNEINAKFCGGCGKDLSAIIVAASGAVCTKCGKVNEANAKFCGGCGNAIIARTVPEITEKPKAPTEAKVVVKASEPKAPAEAKVVVKASEPKAPATVILAGPAAPETTNTPDAPVIEAATETPVLNSCPHCGTDNDINAKFCRGCGQKMMPPAPEAPAKLICPACGKENMPGVNFCYGCGQIFN